MKILIITNTISNSATGIVASRLIEGLSHHTKPEVILQKINHGDLNINAKEIPLQRIVQNEFITKLCLVLFHFPLNELKWIKKVKRTAIKITNNNRPDLIMTLVSASDYAILVAGSKISSRLKIPLYIHGTDPMPAPPHWGEKPVLRRAIMKTIHKAFKKAKYLSLSNETMLEYQLKMLGLNKTQRTFVIHNPVPDQFLTTQPVSQDKDIDIFLFLGNTYTMRKPDLLIRAFAVYAKANQKAVLKFAGSRNPDLDNYDIPINIRSRIKCETWTKKPQDIIEEASVLVDLDIQAEHDVFISSKLMQYIGTDKVILSITSPSSPSSGFLNPIRDSVVFSRHDPDQIVAAMDRAIKRKKSLDPNIFRERVEFARSLQAIESGKKIVRLFKQDLGK